MAQPRTVGDTSVWKEAHETTHAVANAVLAKYGKDALRGRAREAAETWAATNDSGCGVSHEKGELLNYTGGSSPIPTCGVSSLDAQ